MQRSYTFKLTDLLIQVLCIIVPAIGMLGSSSGLESGSLRRLVFCNLCLGIYQIISVMLHGILLGHEAKNRHRYLFKYFWALFIGISWVAIWITVSHPNDNSNNGILLTWLAGGSALLELWYLWVTISELRQMGQH